MDSGVKRIAGLPWPAGAWCHRAMRPGLYAIVDVDTLAGRDVVGFTRRVLDAGPLSALQLRAKSLGAGEMHALATALAPLCRAADTWFFVNDRADVAALSGADGVHLGTTDLSGDDARAAFPALRIGLSSHNDDDVRRALAQSPTYLAFGPVWGTRTKADAAPTVGVEALRAVVATTPRPVVAIGGITLENAPAVCDTGARAGAVISALAVDDGAVTARARALHRALGGG
jgi:thiamine-phosphate pyrophosphorylase